jgi:Flp pilus assembly protein TadG
VTRLFRRSDEGIALVEFALLIPILMMLLVGVFDSALAVWQSNTLTSAAREGTRYAIVHGADSSAPVGPTNVAPIVAVVQRQVIGMSNVSVTASWPDGASTSLAATATAGQPFVTVASTAGFAVGDPVSVTEGATTEQGTIAEILSVPERLHLTANLANTYTAAGTVAHTTAYMTARGKRVKVTATAEYAPVLSQAFLGGALRVTLSGASELVISR